MGKGKTVYKNPYVSCIPNMGKHLLTESKKTYLGKGIQSTFSQFLKMEMNVTVPITVICDKENKNLHYRVIFSEMGYFQSAIKH